MKALTSHGTPMFGSTLVSGVMQGASKRGKASSDR